MLWAQSVDRDTGEVLGGVMFSDHLEHARKLARRMKRRRRLKRVPIVRRCVRPPATSRESGSRRRAEVASRAGDGGDPPRRPDVEPRPIVRASVSSRGGELDAALFAALLDSLQREDEP
jgi:hypothetical protein